MTYENVLVTGGTGFAGSSLQRLRPEWTYLSSRDCDLTDSRACYNLFNDIKPDAIIHLAARVGGIKESSKNQGEFYYLNSMINLNVVHQAYMAGVPRVLASLSTCCFPDISQTYPMIEEDILSGLPTETNFGYGYSKRSLFVQINCYREQYGVNYSTFSPCNLYGPKNDFDLDTSHFVSAMIRRFYEAKDGDTLRFWGSGTPLRQQLYIDDLSKIVAELLEKHNTNSPLIVAPNKNLSIREMIEICRDVVEKDVRLEFNNSLDGQFRKDGSNARLLELLGDFEFTSFKEGVRKTYNWYMENGALNE
tara:strand:+ start:3076 stop:3993 length:918 start_codon:yes stop_codon:yes gene_type:complete